MMIENYLSLKKSKNILVLFIDSNEKKISDFKSQINGEETSFACMIEDLDLEELKRIYEISDEEAKMRNGVKNAVYNSIALKNLR